ncbi:MAG: hypothetical protein HQK67_10800 [Desulfamplus sp.]|nr:hypothetical protein [Desulfamplus sp.]
MLLQAEEMISAKLNAGESVSELKQIIGMFAAWHKQWVSISDKFMLSDKATFSDKSIFSDKLMLSDNSVLSDKNSISLFLGWNQNFVNTILHKLNELSYSLDDHHRSLNMMVDLLLEDVKQVLMLPFSSLTEIFPKMVRDLAREQGKEISINITGSSVEIDRRILEQIKDPLIHMIRNAVDHGIEMPEERLKQNKEQIGHINVEISQVDAFHDGEELGPRMLSRISKHTGLRPEDL